MDFVKMHGLGNDFVIVEEINLPPIELPKLAEGSVTATGELGQMGW